jgi:hypothetical protein
MMYGFSLLPVGESLLADRGDASLSWRQLQGKLKSVTVFMHSHTTLAHKHTGYEWR